VLAAAGGGRAVFLLSATANMAVVLAALFMLRPIRRRAQVPAMNVA
jgi:hypothetical protein